MYALPGANPEVDPTGARSFMEHKTAETKQMHYTCKHSEAQLYAETIPSDGCINQHNCWRLSCFGPSLLLQEALLDCALYTQTCCCREPSQEQRKASFLIKMSGIK